MATQRQLTSQITRNYILTFQWNSAGLRSNLSIDHWYHNFTEGAEGKRNWKYEIVFAG